MAQGQWFYTREGQQAGPVPAEQLRQMVASGQVGPQDLVWQEGMANWVPSSSVPEFRGVGGGGAVGAGVGQPQPQAYGAPGHAPSPYAPMPMAYGGGQTVPNYLVQSILVTIFCCQPFGIVSIVYAAQVNTKLGVGDVAGAQLASENAKKWAWIAFAAGIVTIVGFILLSIIPAVQEQNVNF